jgi:hypothetical protein
MGAKRMEILDWADDLKVWRSSQYFYIKRVQYEAYQA